MLGAECEMGGYWFTVSQISKSFNLFEISGEDIFFRSFDRYWSLSRRISELPFPGRKITLSWKKKKEKSVSIYVQCTYGVQQQNLIHSMIMYIFVHCSLKTKCAGSKKEREQWIFLKNKLIYLLFIYIKLMYRNTTGRDKICSSFFCFVQHGMNELAIQSYRLIKRKHIRF